MLLFTRRMARLLLLLLFLFASSEVVQAAPSRAYEEGQVWAYHTRPGDEGSLMKIQKIERSDAFPDGPIYHISVIDFRVEDPRLSTELPHAPVSRATLDQSVTNLAETMREFPSVEEGIAEWKAHEGGVWTITVAKIIDIVAGVTLPAR